MSKLLVSILTLMLVYMYAVSAYAETIRYHGSSTVLRGIMYKAAPQFKELEGVEFDLKGKSTGVGIEKILAGECDIAGGGRSLTEAEKARGLVQTQLFLDAYAIIVHPKNPVTEISTGQLASILNGNTSSWADFSDFQSVIRMYAPPSKAAHYVTFQREFGFSQLPKFASQARTAADVYYAVRDANGAIGWLSYSTVWQKDDVKILAIKNGRVVKVSEESVSTGEYPYVAMEYFYTQGQPKGSVKKFIDFVKGPAGEKIIVESGFFKAAPVPASIPGEAF